MGIIGWIVLGLLAGAIAKAVLPGDDPGGIIVTIIIGIVDAILGGFLAQVLFNNNTVDDFFDISTWLTAIVGSIILLLVYRLGAGRGRGRGEARGPLADALVRRRASTPPPDQLQPIPTNPAPSSRNLLRPGVSRARGPRRGGGG